MQLGHDHAQVVSARRVPAQLNTAHLVSAGMKHTKSPTPECLRESVVVTSVAVGHMRQVDDISADGGGDGRLGLVDRDAAAGKKSTECAPRATCLISSMEQDHDGVGSLNCKEVFGDICAHTTVTVCLSICMRSRYRCLLSKVNRLVDWLM